MLTADLLKEHLHFDDASGMFFWNGAPSFTNSRGGKVAGTVREDRSISIGVPGHGYFLAHRLAWLYHYGELPKIEIDHKDGNPSNNRIDNLRLATSSQQKQNKVVQSNNRSGLKGAYFHACHKGKKWRSQIKTENGLKFLGYFETALDAHEAYVSAAEKAFGEFHCSGIRRHQERLDAPPRARDGEGRP